MKRGSGPVATVVLTVLALLVAGPTASAQDPPTAPSPKALKKLERVGKAIDQADDAIDKGDPYISALTSAERLKEDFVKRGFAKQAVRGDCGLAPLLLGLDHVDRALARAQATSKEHLREIDLATAQAAAGNVSESLAKCTGAEVPEAAAMVKTIEKLGRDHKLTDGELDKGAALVASKKKALVKGERVYGCDVVEFHLLIDRADIAIDLARIHLPPKADHDELAKRIRERKRRVREADEAVTALIKHWRKVPCGEAGVPPANEPPKITFFGAVFAGKATCSTCTKYSLLAADADGTVESITWKKDPPPGGDPAQTNCGTFDNFERSGGGGSAVWNHPNAADPSASPPVTTPCTHTGIDHPGWITAVVTDDDGATATCVYKKGSTASADFDAAKNCG